MYDLGDTATLRARCVDGSGRPANAAVVTLRVTLPDGTTTELTPANPPENKGDYRHGYTITQHGRHVYRWTFAGGGVPDQAHVDIINAAPADWPVIVGLIETKNYLRIPIDDTEDDENLRGFIAGASRVVEDIVGAVARRTITGETNSGGSRNIRLSHAPVLRVLEVREDGQVVPPDRYSWSPTGLLQYRYGNWRHGLHNVETDYEVGRPVVPDNILEGVKELIRVNWRPMQGGNYGVFDGESDDDFGASRMAEGNLQGELRLGFFVPNSVTQRLAPDKRAPVVM